MKKEILKTLENTLLVNREDLTSAEIEALEKQISYIKQEIKKEIRSGYVKQLYDFIEYIDSCFSVLAGYGDAGENEAFWNTPFIIKFRGQSVSLHNSVDMFHEIEALVKNEIELYWED